MTEEASKIFWLEERVQFGRTVEFIKQRPGLIMEAQYLPRFPTCRLKKDDLSLVMGVLDYENNMRIRMCYDNILLINDMFENAFGPDVTGMQDFDPTRFNERKINIHFGYCEILDHEHTVDPNVMGLSFIVIPKEKPRLLLYAKKQPVD